MSWNKCMYCGQFIKFSDFANNKATRKMITPDSQVSSERYETYHNKCEQKEIEKNNENYKRNGVRMKVFPNPTLADTQNNTSDRLNDESQFGMDLRTYIAIEAMNGLLIKTPLVQVTKGSKDECKVDVQQKAIVESSVKLADLLIKELNKEPDD